jgi:cytochrome P450
MQLVPTSHTLRHGLPIAAGAWPLLGHMPSVFRRLPAFHLEARERFGPLYWVNVGFGNFQLMYSSPEAVSLFKSKAADSSYMRSTAGDLLGESLIVMDGAPHTKVRGTLNPAFSQKGLATANVGAIVGSVMSRHVGPWASERSVKIVPATREIALDIIFQMLGIPTSDLSQWRKAYEEFLFTAVNVPIDLPGFPKWRGRKASQWLQGQLRTLVRDARAKEAPSNMLERMAHARDEDGALVDEQQLIDNIRLLALAGHETTASTMAWMAIHCAQEPRWWDALVEEATRVGQPPASPMELRNFPVAESIFREALRLHPPVAADARVVIGDLELEGHTIPKGTIVGIPIVAILRDPDKFPEPHTFRPERWHGKDRQTPLETIAFGSGPHFCLGYHVAWMEAVSFGVHLALTLSKAGKRLRAPAKVPERYVPFIQPGPKIVLEVVQS